MKLTFNTAFLPIPPTSSYYPKDERAGFWTPTLFCCCEMQFLALRNQVTHRGRPARPRGARTPELCSHLSRLIPAIFHSVLLALISVFMAQEAHSVSPPVSTWNAECYLQSKAHSLQLTPRPQQGSAWRECLSIVTHSFYISTPRMRILHGFVTSSPTGVKRLHIIRLVLASYGENRYEIWSVERDADAHNARSRWGRKLPAFH